MSTVKEFYLDHVSGTISIELDNDTVFDVKSEDMVSVDPNTGGFLYRGSPTTGVINTFGTITQSTDTNGITLKIGSGYLKSFTVLAKGTSPTLTIWNNTTAAGQLLVPTLNGNTAVGDFPILNIGETYVWSEPLFFSNGCHIVIGGTGTTTIQFQLR